MNAIGSYWWHAFLCHDTAFATHKAFARFEFKMSFHCRIMPDKKMACELIAGSKPLQWCHNGHDRVSNHQPHDCLLNRLFRRRSKKTSKLRVTGLCVGPVNSPQKWPVTRKMFPFDDVIMHINNVGSWKSINIGWQMAVFIYSHCSANRGHIKAISYLSKTGFDDGRYYNDCLTGK